MKTRTRVVAWLYILSEVPGLIILALVAFVSTGAGSGFLRPDSPQHIGIIDRVVMFALSGACVLWIGVIVLTLLPWIYLLKKRDWAWWMLTIVYGLASGLSISPLLQMSDLRSYGHQALSTVPGIVCFLPTLLILITDHPSTWKGRRKTTTNRRKRKHTRRYRTPRRYRYD